MVAEASMKRRDIDSSGYDSESLDEYKMKTSTFGTWTRHLSGSASLVTFSPSTFSSRGSTMNRERVQFHLSGWQIGRTINQGEDRRPLFTKTL